MALIPQTPNLGFPKLDAALPASTAAGRSTPWKYGDIIRYNVDNGVAAEAIYLKGAAGITTGASVTYNPVTFQATNGAGTPGPTALSAVALSPCTAGLNGWFKIARNPAVPAA